MLNLKLLKFKFQFNFWVIFVKVTKGYSIRTYFILFLTTHFFVPVDFVYSQNHRDGITVQNNTDKISKPTVIVVLGSSTAAWESPDSWVNQLKNQMVIQNKDYQIINLAVSGITSYHILDSNTKAKEGRPSVLVNNNITKAISLNPDAVIVNLPTNDIASGYSLKEILNNFRTVDSVASASQISVWFTSSQPRNLSLEKRLLLTEMKDSVLLEYASTSFDFYTGLATDNGEIKPEFSFGDGIHLNAAGHYELFKRVWTSKLILGGPLETEKQSVENIQVSFFPNPIEKNGNLSIYSKGNLSVSINLFDITGRTLGTVYSGNLINGQNQIKLNTGSLASGTYFLRINSEGKFKSLKIGILH